MLFDGPATAVRAAQPLLATRDSACSLVIAEVPRDEPTLTGFAVDTAAGLARIAPAGTLWTSATGRDLLAGSGLGLEPPGIHEVEPAGRLELFAVGTA